ncbi:MAG TPA: hypothetical protein VL754_16840 [Verrucomicrobiae bacterium]|jgi:hypothetical protein|nr:hypothetical protein [Verrucomicrobiae bacterium]
MFEPDRRLFVGMKLSSKLQREFESCSPGTEHYFKNGGPEALEIVTEGEEKFIGRVLRDGFPARDIENVSRNVRSIVMLITHGAQIDEDSIRIYGR